MPMEACFATILTLQDMDRRVGGTRQDVDRVWRRTSLIYHGMELEWRKELGPAERSSRFI